jgi:hypothetical protein
MQLLIIKAITTDVIIIIVAVTEFTKLIEPKINLKCVNFEVTFKHATCCLLAK